LKRLTVTVGLDDDLGGGVRVDVVRGEEDDGQDVLARTVELNRINQFRLPLSGLWSIL
jgi:hypothetical protein